MISNDLEIFMLREVMIPNICFKCLEKKSETIWLEWHLSKIPHEITTKGGTSTEFLSHERSYESGCILIAESNLHKYNFLP